ncbi:ion channel [Paenibacillus sp. P96]|uniref:Ion channel n=1 Tax=Paenibacillus zeirhizosphaerae TaxID=2987519 RepID=A0ABT9FV01_9BACL|nr:potassium channel family protein [Paenibacillus sp. P96]MDP4098551.1 ion channel [Paenibacillus sp. P96]
MLFFLRRMSVKMLGVKSSFILMFAAGFVLVSSMIIYWIEPATFGTWFSAVWWVMTTLSTVGYGDYYPVTTGGRLFAMFLYLFGIGLLSLVIGKVVDVFVKLKERRESGRLDYYGKGHVIVLNWSRKAQYAVEELLATDPGLEVVVVDAGERIPLSHERVHFVSGDPTAEATLHKAGIHHARAAIILADPNVEDYALVDGKSLLIVSGIERTAPEVHTTVEIMLEDHISNFKHVHVNDFIVSHEAVSRLAVRSALEEGNAEIFRQLLSSRHGEDLQEVPVDPAWRTYREAFVHLLEQGITLIADRSDLSINRKLDQPIPPDARLYGVCDEASYAQLMKKGRE